MYLSVKVVAPLLGYSERAVRKKAVNGEYIYRYVPSSTGRGGRKMEILLESLPEQAQKAYNNQITGDFQSVINTDYTSTKAQKEKGSIRDQAVAEYRKYERKAFKDGMKRKGDIRKNFIEQWNREHEDFQITSKSLYDWQKNKKKGKSNVDRRGGYNRGKSSVPAKYREYFLNLYLRQSKPTFDSCFSYTQIEANKNGDYIPGKKAFRNMLNSLDKPVITMAREGKKAFEDQCMPTMQRDYAQLKPNDIWVSDHHLWDVFVRIPDGKGGWKPSRPWGSYWMDMRTRKVMSGFIRTEPPNSDVVLLSFAIAAQRYGIPKKAYLDNGKDYKARDLFYPKGHLSRQDRQNQEITGQGLADKDLDKSCNSLAANLQMEVTYAIPYNARAKPIERLFETLENDFGKMYPSYAGSNAKSRPEDLKDMDIMDMITLEEFISQHRLYVENIYNNAPHSGDSMDNRSPDYWYSNIDFVPNIMPKESLFFALMRTSRPRKIGKEGIRVNKELYINTEFQNYIGKEVSVRYNPVEPESVYVFDMDDNFLFVAGRRKKYGFEPTEEDYIKANHEKKLARAAALNGYRPNTKIRSTESISGQLNDFSDSIDKTEMTAKKIVNPVRNERLEETVRRLHSSSVDRNYEDVLKASEKLKQDTNDRQKEMIEKFRRKMLERAEATARQA